MSSDQAPVSSRHVYHTLIKHGLPGPVADRMEIVTEVPLRPGRPAVTTVQRPMITPESRQYECDRDIMGVLRSLPGADPAVRLTMGKTFTVEWDGIRAPI